MSSNLDLVFVVDCTGSMSAYIANAQSSIKSIISEIQASEKVDVRFALVEYRDHPPEESSFVTRVHDFTDSIKTAQEYVDVMSAEGGGDWPECISCGLKEVTRLGFRKDSLKICILISDAPPHGLIANSTFCESCPGENDAMEVLRELHRMEIILYCVGVEPSVSSSRFIKEWFKAAALICGGRYTPLNEAKTLPKIIVYGAEEELQLERVSKMIEDESVKVRSEMKGASEEAVYANVAKNLSEQGIQISSMKFNTAETEHDRTSNEIATLLTECESMASVRTFLKSRDPIPFDSSYSSHLRIVSVECEAPPRATKKSVSKKSGGFLRFSKKPESTHDSLDFSDDISAPPETHADFLSAPLAPATSSLSYVQEMSSLSSEQVIRLMKRKGH